VKNDEKIFKTVEKVDRSNGNNAVRNFKRIARSLETLGRITVRIVKKISNVNNGKACRAMFVVNREIKAAVNQLVSQC
jgi:hypothetical protein